jgi:hypothetical protein
MNDVLLPLCRQCDVNLVTGAGELSITAALDFVKRVRRANRPARVFYIADFDPAGHGMPVSVARKVEFFIADQGLDLDVRFQPLAICNPPTQKRAPEPGPIPSHNRLSPNDQRRGQVTKRSSSFAPASLEDGDCLLCF